MWQLPRIPEFEWSCKEIRCLGCHVRGFEGQEFPNQVKYQHVQSSESLTGGIFDSSSDSAVLFQPRSAASLQTPCDTLKFAHQDLGLTV